MAWNKISKNPSIFIVLTSTIFWGLNYILTFYARKKGYIGTKEQS
ncbi:hypothetical protein J2Z25_002493 [Clostridium tertium]|nr:hypothetical protein [Clostridium tertium]